MLGFRDDSYDPSSRMTLRVLSSPLTSLRFSNLLGLQDCSPAEIRHPQQGSLAVTSYKGCAKSSQCDSGSFAITMNTENYMGSRRRCCKNDGCNQDPLPAFVRNHTENGLRCPSCLAAFKETCTATQDAVCVGEETRCVAVSGIAQPGIKFAARGCGTETACHTKPGTLVPSGSRLLTIKKTGCHPSSQASGKAE
ncbi:hypothetical protein FD754_015020 [Muntiacus muntjak]|uniref:UPAR/Ly6 domain-containing protein n=1 Tax=Muntiacus muntjak TaxID=9888 RepID=A0A5N3VM58_MUNMU|nr:hypothetical protein FD754_015020 [Muntiacus muntjak]